MLRMGYLFERFPSFGQTFCYREVAELKRQGADLCVFSIRKPDSEPVQDWDENVVRRITYLPGEKDLLEEVNRARVAGELPAAAVRALKEWGRQTDFLRLYQAAYIGLLLQKANIQRVHAHFAGMAARTAYWIREFFRIEYSLTVHANDIFVPRDYTVSLPKLFETARVVVTVSDFAVETLKARFPEQAGKFHRVYNGIDPDRFRLTEFRSSPPLILSIGRLIEKKGFDDLIAACGVLAARGQSFRCEIIGEGPLEEGLRAQISDARLEQSVQLVGPRTESQIAERLAAATVFVLPCRQDAKGDTDNLPTVIMEAMAAGLPVVSTNIAGIPEMVQTGVNGELVKPHDPVELAAAIQSFLSELAQARTFGDRSREIVAEKFSIETNVRTLAAIIANS